VLSAYSAYAGRPGRDALSKASGILDVVSNNADALSFAFSATKLRKPPNLPQYRGAKQERRAIRSHRAFFVVLPGADARLALV
jgi:hypothetical protein